VSNPVFDLEGWTPIFPIGGNMGVDVKGNVKMRIGNGLAVDLKSGKMQLTTPWDMGDNNPNDPNSNH
jgi:hypothetical protein